MHRTPLALLLSLTGLTLAQAPIGGPGGEAQAQPPCPEEQGLHPYGPAPGFVSMPHTILTIDGPHPSAQPTIVPSAPAASVTETAPSSFSTLPALPSESIAVVSIPPITPATNTTAGRFLLTVLTALSNPYEDGYTNGDTAAALNNSNVLFTAADNKAPVSLSSSQPLPGLSTFALNGTCLQTWDGRVAYTSPQTYQRSADSSSVASTPLFFGHLDNLSADEVAAQIECSLPADKSTFWQGDPTLARSLTCSGKGLGTTMTEMFVCTDQANNSPGVVAAYDGDIQLGNTMPSGCVPVTLSAVGVGEVNVPAVPVAVPEVPLTKRHHRAVRGHARMW